MYRSHRLAPPTFAALAGLAVALLGFWAAPLAHARVRYYLEVGSIEEGPAASVKFGGALQDIVKSAFKKQGEFEIAEGTFSPPSGSKAFLVKGRIDKYKKEVKPPAPGKRYQTVEVEVRVSLLGTTKPGESFGFRGDGEAIVGTEVSAVTDAEILEASKDALREAFAKAVEKSANELGKAGKKKR
jgi:hypothetical protein